MLINTREMIERVFVTFSQCNPSPETPLPLPGDTIWTVIWEYFRFGSLGARLVSSNSRCLTAAQQISQNWYAGEV